jgi:hypothetical protein
MPVDAESNNDEERHKAVLQSQPSHVPANAAATYLSASRVGRVMSCGCHHWLAFDSAELDESTFEDVHEGRAMGGMAGKGHRYTRTAVR